MAQATLSIEDGNASLGSTESRTGTNSSRSVMGKSLKYCHDVANKFSSYVKKIFKCRPESTENKITFVLWIISISLDPFMCYVPSIHDAEKYLEINVALVISLEVLYCSLMIYRVYNAFLSNKKERRVFNWTESMALVFSNLVLWALVLNPTLKIRSTVVSILLAKYLFVCTVRVIGIYRLFMEEVTRTSLPLAEAALIKIVINLLLYLYGGHLFGGWWYLFAVWKKMDCWKQACRNHSGCHYANRHFHVSSGDNNFLNDYCSAKTEDTKIYELGIFKDAFESRILETTKFGKRLLYCFRWGLQNISGFGQNLQVSTRNWENFFVILIIIYGVGTFTFFIGNMQNLIKSTSERSEEKKQKEEAIKRKHKELEQWFPFGKISVELQNRIKEYQQNKWQQTEGVDVENLLCNLPKDLEYNIKREFCLDLIKKVDKFGRWGDALLVHLCEYVKPVVYLERTRIVHEGDPIDEMLFVVQGNLWTYSSKATNTAGSTSNARRDSMKDHLKNGDFWGEELVSWVQNNPSSWNIPISNKNIQALTKVEAFVLGADDLKCLFLRNQNVLFIQSFFRYRRILLSSRNAQMTTQDQ